MNFYPDQCYKLLQIFGDGATHSWFEVINIGVRHFKIHQYKFEAIFKRGLEYGLIEKIPTQEILRAREQSSYIIGWEDFNYKISERGDECFRAMQIRRGGEYSFYKHYDRSVHGKYGLDRFAPLPKGLTPMNGKTKTN